MGSAKRVLLRTVAALLIASAALAIGILVVGRFGQTEGRIIGTTAVLAAYGLLALPATMLFDQGRWMRWAFANVAVIAAAAATTIGGMWSGSDSELVGKTIGALTAYALASTQVSALQARRQPRDPRVVVRLFALSSIIAGALATTFAVLIWTEPDASLYPRLFGALVVLDLLCVALQPVLARLRAVGTVYELVVVAAPGERRHLSVEATNLGAAVAKAIRTVEREGGTVVRVDIGEPVPPGPAARRPAASRERSRTSLGTSRRRS